MRAALRAAVLSLPLLLLLVPRACGQEHTPALPAVATGHFAGSASHAPFGRSWLFVQVWYRGDNLGLSTVLREIGMRPSRHLTALQVTPNFELVLSSTTAGFSTLSRTFASNLGRDATVVFSRKGVQHPTFHRHDDPNEPPIWIPADRPFVFQGPHLLLQVDMQVGMLPPSSMGLTSDALFMVTPADTYHARSGVSCGGGLASSWSGTHFELLLSGAPPSGPVLFLLGAGNQTLAGSMPLPVDLGPLGMPGCALAVDPLLLLPATAGSTGSALLSVPLGIPADSIAFHAQALHGTAANPAGLATTNAAHTILGGAGLVNYLYNWDVFGSQAQFGPFPTNRGPVLLYRR